MLRKRRIKPEQDAKEHVLSGKDKAFIEKRYINAFKGRGVFALEHIKPSTFVVEYRGVLSQSKYVDDIQGNYLFDFTWNGAHYCIDASKEDGSLGRLVNDDHKNPNCKVKTVVVEGKPHLCLFSLRDICPDEEIIYNYGDSSWPWRSVELCDEISVAVDESIEGTSSSGKEKELCDEIPKAMDESIEAPSSSGKEKELCDEISVAVDESIEGPSSSGKEKCHHEVHCAVISSLDSCVNCSGPVSSRKWLGLTCKLCSRTWHKTCFMKNEKLMDVTFSSSEESSSDEEYTPQADKSIDESSDEFIPDSRQNSDSCDSLIINTRNPPYCKTTQLVSESKKAKSVSQPTHCSSTEQDMVSDISSSAQDLICNDQDKTTSNTEMLQSFKKTPTESCDKQSNLKDTFSTHENYCYVCKKPQSKIARHFKIAAAFLLPKHSKDRKRLLEKLRNRGNYEHNQEVMENKSGPLKVRRRPVRSEIELSTKTYVHCIYCKGLFVRKELWRHTRRCPSKICSESEATGKAKVLVLADIAESTFSQAISPEVWKILGNMKNDDISSVVRNDFLILQLSQSLYNKHGSDPTKFEYIRQKVREVGRLLLSMRKKFSILSFEDALKPNNFYKVIEAVKDVAGYEEKSHSYKTPSLALKLGHSLNKIADIILCRAIAREDDALMKAAERFKRLCSSEWAEHVSHAALATLSKSKFNKPSTIPFTHDVQLLHQCLEKKSAEAFENLKNHESSQAYAELAKVTLAQVIIFNRRRAGEVSKMTLECFMKRDQTELHEDIALGLSPFEQKMSKHFSRVEIMGKKGRKVAVLLSHDLVGAIQLLVDKRDSCEVDGDNPFLFARPKCSATSFFRGQDCIRLFANQCGAQNPEYLRSTQLRKQVATMSQILNLKDNELDQLANFLGHDIRVHRDFYRLPDATIEIAKISKLLLAMEIGTLGSFQGKSLSEIEIEDEIDPELDEEEVSDEEDEESDSLHGVNGNKKRVDHVKSTQDEETESSNGKQKMPPNEPVSSTGKRKMPPNDPVSSTEAKSRRIVKRPWTTNEVNAVMKHFKVQISKGHLATKAECEQCKTAEDPVLRERTVQNIRDFVRNRGLMLKKNCS
nr:uncharacterized protein LOC129428912 isoform X2 [Misgurnus anguillicaudatus]XP_055041258.1 uncharacterized protein LOC129428912 isoform X2 [Misgurnus anguillicaudatus]